MSEGPINPDREQQEADNLASSVQSHVGPLPAELEKQLEAHKARARGETADAADGEAEAGDGNAGSQEER